MFYYYYLSIIVISYKIFLHLMLICIFVPNVIELMCISIISILWTLYPPLYYLFIKYFQRTTNYAVFQLSWGCFLYIKILNVLKDMVQCLLYFMVFQPSLTKIIVNKNIIVKEVQLTFLQLFIFSHINDMLSCKR